MKPTLSLKTLYRSPVRTILTFILLAAVTFALFSQVMEYAIAKRELEKAVALYDGIATAEVSPLSTEAARADTPAYMFTDPRVSIDHMPQRVQERFRKLTYECFTSEQLETLSTLPYITYTDTRYMTAGYSDIYKRIDDGKEYFNYTYQCVVEATVEFSSYGRVTGGDIKVIGGEPKRKLSGSDYIYIVAESSKRHAEFAEIYQEPINNYVYYDGWSGHRSTIMVTNNSVYNEEYLQKLEIGKRYLFVLRYDKYRIDYVDTEEYFLTDPFVQEYCDAIIPLENEPENYLETEKFSGVRNYIDRINENLYTFDVV